VLTVTATSGADTIIVYRTTASGIRVRENGTDSAWFPATGANPVNRIDVFGQGGADSITIERSISLSLGDVGVNKQTKLNGGEGNDTINGGENNDTINGDGGDDTLRGFEADDTIYGGNGYDRLEGGDGNDSLWGCIGDSTEDDALYDTLYGEVGNDSLFGEGGQDWLEDPAGANVMYGGAGNDTLKSNEFDNDDILDGGTGTDCGWWDDGDTVSNMEGRFL
jgi:Ca2+-binding RTX toxin-like protein